MSKVNVQAAVAMCGAAVIGGVVLFLAALLTRGLVITLLWSWFMVPVFGLPALGIASALGLTLVLNYLLDPGKKGNQTLVEIFTTAGGVLVIGYVIHLFM
jgi:hypothetical protein